MDGCSIVVQIVGYYTQAFGVDNAILYKIDDDGENC